MLGSQLRDEVVRYSLVLSEARLDSVGQEDRQWSLLVMGSGGIGHNYLH